jgi:alkaline phosphatase
MSGSTFEPTHRGEPAVIARPSHLATLALALMMPLAGLAEAQDRLKEIQAEAVKAKGEKIPRAYHFGSQGAGGVFSNHTSHSNRLIPVYTFGRKVDLGAFTGSNSPYRDPAKVKALYGFLPERTVNPEAEYADQSDLYRVQKAAVDRGVKYLFIVWFDGMDWEATRAAAIARSGQIYREGKGSGLIFQDYTAEGSARFGYYVTSPTHDKNTPDLDAQTVSIPSESAAGGYDASIAGPNPWTLGPLGVRAPGYLKGQSGNKEDKAGVASVGGVIHAYTDSSTSAGEFATGVKSYNNGINVTDDGRFVPTLFNQLQAQGWKVGTVTSVPFPHASPAGMYAHNVHRDDYQDLGRDMLGLPSIVQLDGKEAMHPGLDVVIGTGFGQAGKSGDMVKQQGKNAVEGNAFITDADLAVIDVNNGGKYAVVQTKDKVNGAEALLQAATRAGKEDQRLFGFYGKTSFNHLPYRTADGGFDPVAGITGKTEKYTPDDLNETPTLADLTRAGLLVLANKPGKPFALFVEAGDVDFALHDNNLDNAVGAVLSGEDAIKAIIAWVEKNSNWDDAAMIVTADHGHYLVIDQPEAIAGTAK